MQGDRVLTALDLISYKFLHNLKDLKQPPSLSKRHIYLISKSQITYSHIKVVCLTREGSGCGSLNASG